MEYLSGYMTLFVPMLRRVEEVYKRVPVISSCILSKF